MLLVAARTPALVHSLQAGGDAAAAGRAPPRAGVAVPLARLPRRDRRARRTMRLSLLGCQEGE